MMSGNIFLNIYLILFQLPLYPPLKFTQLIFPYVWTLSNIHLKSTWENDFLLRLRATMHSVWWVKVNVIPTRRKALSLSTHNEDVEWDCDDV